MAATKKPSEVLKNLSNKELEKFLSGDGRWRVVVYDELRECEEFAADSDEDWRAESPFGAVESAVVVDKEGKPVFDRPAYREAPNVNIVAYGKEDNGRVRVAVIRQPRPHADDPEHPSEPNEPIVFGQIPMGFLERIIGKDMIQRFEASASGAAREVAEETGAQVVKNIIKPKFPWLNPSPSFVATWSELYFVEVDLAKIEELKADRNEPIFSAEYVTLADLRQRIAAGTDEQGAVYRYGNALALWMIFLSHFPEFASQLVD